MTTDVGSTSYSETDNSNNNAPPGGWPAGMNGSQVEPTGRAMMGALKRLYGKVNPTYTTGGTTTAYTLTSTTAETAYYNGQFYAFVTNATCGATPSLNIDGLGAVNLRKFTNSGTWATLAAGDILANQIVVARYNSSGGGTFDIAVMSFSLQDLIKLAQGSRTTVSDAAYTVLTTDNTIAYTSLTTSRTVTLPAANTWQAGKKLAISDESGSASQTVQISLAPNGTDTIAGSNSTQVLINIPRGRVELYGDGASGWWLIGAPSVRYANALGSDVSINVGNTYFDGPSVAQGTVGVWRAYGSVTILGANQGAAYYAKLWDGTTAIASAAGTYQGPATPTDGPNLAFSGILAGPAGNLRISVQSPNSTSGIIAHNTSGEGKDSTITVERIA